MVHTADIDGPESLHPNIPQRNGELLVRRALVEEGLALMRRMHMIEAKFTADGIVYVACDQAGPFVRLRRKSGCGTRSVGNENFRCLFERRRMVDERAN